MDIRSAIDTAVRKLEVQGLDGFEVAGICDSSLVIESKRQMVELFRRSSSRGIAVRVLKGGRAGFASTTGISNSAVEMMAQQVLGTLQYVAPSDSTAIPKPQIPSAGLVERTGRSFSEIPDEEKMKKALMLESSAIARDSRISKVQHPIYEEHEREMMIVNSEGIKVTARRGVAICGLKAVASDKGRSEGGYESFHARCFEDLDSDAIGKAAADRALAKLGGGTMPAGEYPVILEPRAAAVMARIAAPSFFADNVQLGRSVLAEKLGKRAWHQDVTIVDDGLLPGGAASFPFDGEGVTRQRTSMVRNGIIEGWLYDGGRALRDRTRSTGNSQRESLTKKPVIGVSNCFLKAGEKAPADMLKQISKGLLVTDLAGVHTANTISGDFSLGAEGMLIEGGVVTRPVKGITLAGNVHTLFLRIAGIGSDLRFFGPYGAPSILVEGLMVGS